MTMFDPESASPPANHELMTWLQDQVGALKAHAGRISQQGDQLQAAMLDLNEKMRDVEGRIREITAKTMGVPTMQDQVRQLSGLLDRIQDTELLIDTKFEVMERQTHEERTRDQSEKNDLYRRVQDLERRSEALNERQSGIDDAARRYQEDVSRSHITLQALTQRFDALETKTGRNLDTLMRLEQAHSETEGAIRALRREDDAVAERARLAHEVALRVEAEVHNKDEEFREVPLLAERVELLRAERQRLEDRVSRMEETLVDVGIRVERQEETAAQIEARMKSNDSRIDHVHSSTLDYRRALTDQLLKLNQMLERMKRRQVEELERDVKELRTQSNQLKNADDEG